MSKKRVVDAGLALHAQEDLVRNYLHDACQLLDAECGPAAADGALADVGLLREDLKGAGTSLHFDHYFGFLDWLYRKRPLPGVEVMLGLGVRVANLGLYGHAMSAASTTEEVLRLTESFMDTTWAHTKFVFERRGRYAVGRYLLMPELRYSPVPLLLHITASAVSIGRVMLPTKPWGRAELHYAFARPVDATLYQHLLGCRLKFGCDHTEIRLPVEWIADEIEGDRQATSALDQAMSLYRAMSAQQGAARQVAQVIEKHGRGSQLAVPDVAACLGWSARTLARRLSDEGTSYRRELERIRMQWAVRYLTETSMNVAEVSGAVGYAQQPSFQRAFRACFGVTPQQFRDGAAAVQAATALSSRKGGRRGAADGRGEQST